MAPLGTFGVLGALLAPATAFASHGHDVSRVEIANFFDGEVELYLDGRFRGLVPGDGRLVVDHRPGPLDVVVRRPGTGFVLVSTQLYLSRDARVFVPVEAPRSVVRVRNAGEVALKVDVDHQHVWLAPHTTVDLRVTSGFVDLRASIRDPRGDYLAMTRDLWVEPGRLETTVLSPDPSAVRIYNREHVAVRVLLDGVDVGMLAPGATREMFVRPGNTRIVLVDLAGNVRYTNFVDVPRGGTAIVDLHSYARGPVPVHTAMNTPRPGRY
jgi:hypothetical protein